MSTTSLAYMVQAIEDQEFGDIRSILDELYPKPTSSQLKVLFNLLYVCKGCCFTFDVDAGWGYIEFED
jgi:hypothetical protein